MVRILAIWVLRLVLGALCAGLVVAVLAGGPTQAAPAGRAPPGAMRQEDGACWNPVANAGGTSLASVSARTADDIWAVGYTSGATATLGLIQHWDGSQWHLVPSPDPSATNTYLTGVAALGSTNVWAVGWYRADTGGVATAIEHWDGAAWSVVPSPNPAAPESGLAAVAAVSADDVWAVGGSGASVFSPDQTLVEHWDGQQWSIVPSPNPSASGNWLQAVAAAGPSEVWAVGSTGSPAAQTLIERWDGQEWSVVPSPNPTSGDLLAGVWAAAPSAAWAVGYTYNPDRTLVLRWDGNQWQVVPSPNPSGDLEPKDLSAIAGSSPQDIWAAGSYLYNNRFFTLIEHWDGQSWTIVPSGSPGARDQLHGVVAATPGQAWAVGDSLGSGALTEYYPGACLTPTPTLSPTPTPCVLHWDQVTSPNIPGEEDGLHAVAGPAADDLWAVGEEHYATPATLMLHWDGVAWTIVPSPNPPATFLQLNAVTALTSADVWAAGYYYTATNYALLEHWDGSAWALIPGAGDGTGRLFGVAGSAPDDVWAVGDTGSGGGLIEHWDGQQWSRAAVPAIGSLYGVAALSRSDAWAVGASGTLHWDGSTWTPVPDALPAGSLNGVAALGPADVWAVGGDPTTQRSVTEHWDGTAWTAFPGPSPYGSHGDTLAGVAMRAADDVWAVGTRADLLTGRDQVLAGHWDGQTWSMADTPSYSWSTLQGVSAVPGATTFWAVGYYWTGYAGPDATLILRYTPTCPPPAATPTATSTASRTVTPPPVGTPSRTATPPPTSTPSATATRTGTGTPMPTPPTPNATRSATPTPPGALTATPAPPAPTRTPLAASPTPCGAGFSDVRAGDYFYTPVLDLACRGALAGYADGTFRPYADTTRTQQVKIAVLGFGAAIITPPAGGATFADVPPASPFFAVVETAAADGLVSGYRCGGPGEPCDAQRRPYFRPYAGVTRGQVAKIAVGAAGWALRIPATATFADVPVGSPFYSYVETAVCHGVISGYADGTFRPGASATRGQIAKIVYLSITSGSACRTP